MAPRRRATGPRLSGWPDDGLPRPLPGGGYATATVAGDTYVLLAGSPQVISSRFVAIPFDSLAAAERYQSGAAGGAGGDVAGRYAAVWRRIEGLPPPRPRPPARSWASLSEGTRRGYRGPIRRVLGKGATEGEIAAYFDSTPDKRAIRRHPGLSMVTPSDEAFRFARPKRGQPQYIVTWRA